MDISAWLDEVNAATAAGVPAPAYPGSLTQAPASAPVQSTQSILQSSAPTATQGSVPQSVLNYDPWANMGYGAPVQDYWQQYVQKNPLGIDWSTWTPPTGDIGAGGQEFVPGVGPVGFDSTDFMMKNGLGLDYYETRPFGQKTDAELIKALQRGKDSVSRVDKQYMNPYTWRKDLVTSYGLDETGGLKKIDEKWDTKDIRSRSFGERSGLNDISKVLFPVDFKDAINPLNVSMINQIPEAYEAGTSGGGSFDWGRAVDRVLDPGGGIDKSLRNLGDIVSREVPEISPYATALGTTIGSVVSPGMGTAIGYGVGTKIAQGNNPDANYGRDLLNAGAAYLGGSLAGSAGSAVDSAISGTTGAIASGATQGAVAGGISALPTAIETGDWGGVGTGALTGAFVGGVAGGVNDYFTPAGDASPAYDDYINSGGKLSPSSQNIYDAASLELGSGGISFAGDNTMFQVDPSLVSYTPTSPLLFGGGNTTYPVDTSLLSAPSPSRFPSTNPLAPEWPTYTMAPGLSPIQLDPEALPGLNEPELFSNDAIRNALGEITEGYDPNFVRTLTGGSDNIQGWHFDANGDFVAPSDFMLAPDLPAFTADPFLTTYLSGLNPITDYTMGNIPTAPGFDWEKLFDGLGGLSGSAIPQVPAFEATSGTKRGDDSAYVEPPMRSGKGSGSKGLTAEEYEKLYNGTSFMPDTKEIERFNKQGLYYT